MTEIISFVNLKGGVGKTALAVNFAAYCGTYKNAKTLLIDIDPQTNATFASIHIENWDKHSKEHGTIANLLGMKRHVATGGNEIEAEDILIEDVFENVDLIPSHLDLFTIDLDLASATAREWKLKRKIRDIIDDYEYIVCDCPPNLTIPTQNALALSTHFVVPVSPDYLSALGIGILLNRVKEFCRDLEHHELKHTGIVLSRVGRSSHHRESVKDDLRDRFKDYVFDTEIKERTVVSEAASKQRSVFEMHDRDAIDEFGKCYDELLANME